MHWNNCDLGQVSRFFAALRMTGFEENGGAAMQKYWISWIAFVLAIMGFSATLILHLLTLVAGNLAPAMWWVEFPVIAGGLLVLIISSGVGRSSFEEPHPAKIEIPYRIRV